jgi:hypothetical protein
VVDELLSRRREFRAGRQIQLADGQWWTFPAPGDGAGIDVEERGDYQGLIRAVLEAEDGSERLLAELALAIHLIGVNYKLSPENLAFLLTFPRGSKELAESQHAFSELAREHIQSEMNTRGRTLATGVPIQGGTRAELREVRAGFRFSGGGGG